MVPDLIFETMLLLPKDNIPYSLMRYLQRYWCQRRAIDIPFLDFHVYRTKEEKLSDGPIMFIQNPEGRDFIMIRSLDHKIRYITEVKDGHRCGRNREWYLDGIPRYDCTYLKSRFHGEQRKWYTNGNPKYHFFHYLGRFHGVYQSWYESGRREYLFYYHYGVIRRSYKFADKELAMPVPLKLL